MMWGELDECDRQQETQERERLREEGLARMRELDRIMKKVNSILTEDEIGFLWKNLLFSGISF